MVSAVTGRPTPAGGLLAGLLLAGIARPLVRLRARRRARAADRRLRSSIDAVAEEIVPAPMAGVRQDAARFREAVEAARR